MHAETGRYMDLVNHVAQSINNILFTRIGTRLMREEYGSLLPELMDAPLNEATLLRCNVAVVTAIARWEPRYTITAAATQAVPYENGLRVQIRLNGRLNGNAHQFIINVS